MLSTVLSVAGAIVVLLLFVLVHEFGHYFAGKKLGFDIVEFAVGFGPRIFKKEKNGTLFSVKAFPLGGSCMFYGEDEQIQDRRSFGAQKRWKRAVVVAGGALMNILFSLVLAVALMFIYGEYGHKTVDAVTPGSAAEAAGVLPGDLITGVDGKPLQISTDLSQYMAAAEADQVLLRIERGGRERELWVKGIHNPQTGVNLLGVTIYHTRTTFAFGEGIRAGYRFVGSMVGQMLDFLGGLFTRGVQDGDVQGPVGTISIIGMAVRTSFEIVLQLCVLIGVNLGIVNLLPFPGLDGGRLLLLGVEGIRRKALPARVEAAVHFTGLVLLFGLMILLTFGDIRRLIGG